MTVNVAGQVSQIPLGQNKALWPFFETVINSIQSLEDTTCEQKMITVEAVRNTSVQIRVNPDGTKTEEISHFEEFIVSDNGNGFNDANYRSFMQAYSQLKVKKGCKGIGRFLWLKAFEKISIESVFYEDGKWYSRAFEFTLDGVSPENNLKELDGDDHHLITKVRLIQFKPIYRDSVALKLESLAKKTIEHCLPYFIMGTCPRIVLKDNIGETFSLNEYYEKTYKDSLHQDPMILKGKEYRLYHMLLTEGADKHELHLCANNREVKSFDLSRHIPNMQKRIRTEIGDCYYVGYLAGDYLDEAVNAERSEFMFTDLPIMGEYGGAGEEDIVESAIRIIKTYLQDDLSQIDEEKKQQVDRFVQSRRPQYRLMLNKRPDVYDQIPAGLTDEKLDIELYRHQQKWEYETVQKKHDIEECVKKNATDDEAFQKLFDEYCQSITDLSRAGLAEYVARRKAVIDLLAEALEADENGKYSKEDRIHSIICPMQVSSDDVKYDDMNLWLIDDRLAYHHYLASDKKMNALSVLDIEVNKRMDIAVFDAALSYAADPENISSITIIELKRPMRNDLAAEDKDPITQVYDYVTDIKDGKVKKANGRGFGNVLNVAFYCYVVADITTTLKKCALRAGLIQTQDGEGYFGYNPSIGTYIEVISYGKMLKDAKQRNKVLFDKLFEPKASDVKHPEYLG